MDLVHEVVHGPGSMFCIRLKYLRDVVITELVCRRVLVWNFMPLFSCLCLVPCDGTRRSRCREDRVKLCF